MKKREIAVRILFSASALAASMIASADLNLTSAPKAAGWTQSIFAYGFPDYIFANGPNGIAFNDAGQVLVSDHDSGELFIFPNNADGQAAPPAAFGYGSFTQVGLCRVGTTLYAGDQANSAIYALNQSGARTSYIAYAPHATGITVNPTQPGHLLVTGWDQGAVTDVDVAAHTSSVWLTLPYQYGDGIATDGKTVYVESNQHIFGFDAMSKSLVFDSGVINGANGCVTGSGPLKSHLFVSTTDGYVFDVNTKTEVITLLASGGGRGDFLAIDPNGSLLVTQNDRIVRLTPPSGETLLPPALTISKPNAPANSTVSATVKLLSPAPTDMTVTLSCTNPLATVPLSVVIPAGSLSATFSIVTLPNPGPLSTGTVTASIGGYQGMTVELDVKPNKH